MWNRLGIKANRDTVLDIGGLDGYWLSNQQAKIKICLDLDPQKSNENVSYIKANALVLPFADECFDQVFAFDVIEHIDDDDHFLKELQRVTKADGQIIISTPHKHITIFPSFLTGRVSRAWGHHRLRGYLESEIRQIMPKNSAAKFLYQREPFFRVSYLLLRLLWRFNQRLTTPLVNVIAYLDTILMKGEKGHLVVLVTREAC